MERSPDPRTFRAILFDVDGTLVNTIPMIVAGLGDSLKHFTGHRPDSHFIKSLIGTPLSVQMNLPQVAAHPSTLEERIRFTMDCYVANQHLIKPFHQAETVFESCVSRGLKVALVTSRNAEELEWMLEKFPMFAQAHARISASDVVNPKPAADPALIACSMLGVDPCEAVFVGDSTHDVHCAQAAGIFSVAVAYGGCTRTQLASENPDILLDTPTDLTDWFDTNIFKNSLCYSTTQNESRP